MAWICGAMEYWLASPRRPGGHGGRCVLALVACSAALACGDQLSDSVTTDWGRIEFRGMGLYELVIERLPTDRTLPLPTPFPHLVSVETLAGQPQFVPFEFNSDATSLQLRIPAETPPLRLQAQTSEHTQQFADGRIVLTARDARVSGQRARLESHPGNDRIGFWTDPQESVAWEYRATRWGMYRALLTYSCAGPDGNEIVLEATAAGREPVSLPGVLKSTGSWYRYTTLDLGRLYLPAAGPVTFTVRCTRLVGGAVMNLKAILLLPACEGMPPVQADDGSVTLHARDATVHGTVLRWEPAEAKQTLGYWVVPTDAASWTVTVTRPGRYDVEVWQGCGTGQGGSEMEVVAGEQQLPWVVEETGHFQNFRPRTVGQFHFDAPGQYEVRVRPQRIAHKAACDIRQIRLLPAAAVR